MLIIGCGNRDRGDDAAGVLVAEGLRQLGMDVEIRRGEAAELIERRHFGRGHFRQSHRRGRHLVRHRRHGTLRGRRRHHRPGNRSQRKARDHQDREQTAYGKGAFHGRKFSQTCGDGKVANFQFMRHPSSRH